MDIKNQICSRLFFDSRNDIGNTVLLAGTGRSGTTWISNIINFDNEFRDIFEPFSNHHTKECHAFAYKQYLRENDSREYYIKTAQQILTGQIKNKWTDKNNRRFFCKKRLVKDIRINLMLKWLRQQFPELKIIFSIRHPIAVAYSRVRLGWHTHLDEILCQQDLVDDFLVDKINIFQKNRLSQFEKQIFLWCIENYVPLNSLGADDAFIACYEFFCTDPLTESKKLFRWIDKEYDDRITFAFEKPSIVSETHSAIKTGENLVQNWQKHVSKEDCEKAVKILSRFGMDKYYNDSPLPLKTITFKNDGST